MALKKRMYGHSLSSIERELIFSREDTGFVRQIHASGAVFYLDPSPFLPTPKREVYIAHCPPPGNGALVRVSVTAVKHETLKDAAGYYTLVVKDVDAWEPTDPATLVSKNRMLSPGEVRDYFTIPYRGEEELVDAIALCSALYAVSSPPLPEEKGGVSAAILGKKKPWSGFKRSLQVIPSEFRKPGSPFFYRISEKEKMPGNTRADEVSLAFLNPEQLPMHIPVVLDEVEVRSPARSALDMESLHPMVTAYILDSLILKPELPASLESCVTDSFHAIIEDVKGSGSAPYKQDFSSLVPRLGLSIGRYSAHQKLSREDVTRAVDLWSDMYYRAKRVVSTQYDVSRLYRLDDSSRKLYLDLIDAFALETPIPVQEVRDQLASSRDDSNFDEALDTLNRNGLLIKPVRNVIKILDNRPVSV
jgi:hypothetical protein